MSTYEELPIILSVAMLVVAILNLTHKKIAVLPWKANDYFLMV